MQAKQAKGKKPQPGVIPDNFVNYCFPKGVSGNPLGRQKLPADLKKVRELDGHLLKRIIAKHFQMELAELSAILADPKSKAIDVLVAKTIMVSLESGNIEKAEFLFKRSLGNVSNDVKLTVKNQLKDKTQEQKIEAGRKALEFLEAQKSGIIQSEEVVEIAEEDIEI